MKLSLLVLSGVLAWLPITGVRAEWATRPDAVRALPAGVAAPDASIDTLDGKTVPFKVLLGGKPTVLVFYRGGWCPFCNLQLSELRKLLPDLAKYGFQLIAVSPDSPEALSKSLAQQPLEYQLVSDRRALLMQAFGIGYKVDAETLAKLGEYGIDLEQASGGQNHKGLPVPAVFVLDAEGLVQFAYVNPDYRTRVPERLLRAAVESVHFGEAGRPMK